MFSVLFFTVFFEGERHDLSKTGGFGRKMPPPPGKPVTFYECHPEDHAPAPSVRADLIELLAGYVAAFLWGGLTAGRYVVMYIDNEASRLALIKAYSSTQMGNVLVQMFVAKEDASQWKVWFGRVCSHSNIADARVAWKLKTW